jgi:hypothetical protein
MAPFHLNDKQPSFTTCPEPRSFVENQALRVCRALNLQLPNLENVAARAGGRHNVSLRGETNFDLRSNSLGRRGKLVPHDQFYSLLRVAVRRGLEFSGTHQTPSFAGWRPNFGFGHIFGTSARSLYGPSACNILCKLLLPRTAPLCLSFSTFTAKPGVRT